MYLKHFLIAIFLILLNSGAYAESLDSPKKSSAFNTGYGQTPKDNHPQFFALGLGLNFPDIVPLIINYRMNKHLSFRGFFTPPLPFNITVELPQDKVGSQGGLIVEHPPLTIEFSAIYGPSYGLEALFFPFGGIFYISAGTSYRQLSIVGDVSSPLILKNDDTVVSTNTIFSVGADAKTAQWVGRSAIGFQWNIAERFLIDLTLIGAAFPYTADTSVTASTDITNPLSPDQDPNDALKAFQVTKEAEMETKALKEIEKAEDLVTPIIGLSFAVVL